MKSRCNTISSDSNYHSDDQHLSWGSKITSCSPSLPPFVSTAPSSPSSSATTPASQFAFPEMQNNKISVQLAATSSSSSQDEVSPHKRSSSKGHNASSLSTGSDFEFDSPCLSEINDDPPASPKLIYPSTANYWEGFSNKGRLEVIMQSNPNPSSPSRTPVINARQQTSDPSSPVSVTRQLMAEKVSDNNKGYYFDYYSSSSASQITPTLQLQKQGGQLVKQRLSQDIPSLRAGITNDQGRSKSAVLDRRALELSPLIIQKQVYLADGLEHNSHLSSSSAVNSVDTNEVFDHPVDQPATISKSINRHSSNSDKKWAFKDLLRRSTVPSSHHRQSKYANPKFESPRQSTSSLISSPNHSCLLYGLSKSAPTSPAASPPLSPAAAVSKPTPTLAGRLSPPPRPPMSPHALHYEQQKARSDELKRKTFLPYRQRLLGCLGGATTSHHSRDFQQVW